MSKIIIADYKTDEVLDHIIQNDVIDNAHEQDMSTWVETFEFETFANKEYAKHLTDRNLLLIPAEDGGFRELFIVNATRFSTSTGAKMIDITAYGFYQKLATAKIIEPGRTPSQAAEPHMRDILASTNVRVGNVAYTGNRTITRENKTDPFAALKSLANEFDLELNFRVEIENGKVVRYADLLNRIGEWRGRTVEFGRDLQTISRKSDSSNIITALLVLGPRREDGSRIEEFVPDEDARKRWSEDGSHIVKTYEPQTENTEITRERLRTLGRTELNKRINAIVSWEINITDLEHVPGMSGMKIRYGDTIFVKDTGFNPPFYVEARIFKQRRNIFNPGSKQVTLGDFREFTIQEVRSEWEKLREELEKKIGWLDLRVRAGVIEGSLRIIEKDKLTVDSRYAEISVHPNLPTSIFNNLADAKATYDMSYTTLHSYLTDENEDFEYLYEVYSADLAQINHIFDLALDEIALDRDDRIQEALDRARGDLEEAKDNIDDARKRLDESRDRLDDADSRLDDARDRLDGLRDDLDETNNRLLDKVNVIDYEERIGDLVDDIAQKVDGEWVDDRLRVELDNLEIGGRNLLVNSGYQHEPEIWNQTNITVNEGNPNSVLVEGNSSTFGVITDRVTDIEVGQTYTVSFDLKTTNVTELSYTHFMDSSQGNSNSFPRFTNIITDGEWHSYSATFVSTIGRTNVGVMIATSSSYGTSFEIRKLILVEGNKVGTWQPAPEDIFADLDNKPNFDDIYMRSDLDGMFDNTVSLTAYQADQDGYIERFLDYETNVSQTWEAINARVESTDYDYDQGILENRLTEWEATAEGITQSVSNLRVDFDGLEIGGRNLIPNSDFSVQSNAERLSARSSNTYIDFNSPNDFNASFVRVIAASGNTEGTILGIETNLDKSINLMEGETYTLSFLAIKSGQVNPDYNYTYLMRDSGGNTSIGGENNVNVEVIGTAFTSYNVEKVTITFIAPWSDDSAWLLLGSRTMNDSSSVQWIRFSQPQLEKGNKATDWSPAFEDVTTYTETRIEQLADEISLMYIKDDELIAGIRIGEDRINGANIEITGDTLFYGSIRAPDATFIDLTTDNLYGLRATIHNGTVTGTLDANDVIVQKGIFDEITVLDADIERGNIIDANIENATITGDFIAGSITGVDIYGSTITSRNPGIALSETIIQGGNITSRNVATGAEMTVRNGNISGGSITSNTSIDVTTDLHVGNNAYLGDGSGGMKSLYFNHNTSGNIPVIQGLFSPQEPYSSLFVGILNGSSLWFDSIGNTELTGNLDVTATLSADRLETVSTLDYRLTSGHAAIFVRSGQELRVTNGSGSYTAVRGSAFPTGSSERIKSDIVEFEDSALDILRDTTIYSYYKDGVPNRELGMIIERDLPDVIKYDDESINSYSHSSLNTKAIQELDKALQSFQRTMTEEINWLKTENQFLRNEIKKLKEKVA